jgi:hypothetical protein
LKGDVNDHKNKDSDLEKIKVECERKIKTYRKVLNEKTVLYDEMFSKAK